MWRTVGRAAATQPGPAAAARRASPCAAHMRGQGEHSRPVSAVWLPGPSMLRVAMVLRKDGAQASAPCARPGGSGSGAGARRRLTQECTILSGLKQTTTVLARAINASFVALIGAAGVCFRPISFVHFLRQPPARGLLGGGSGSGAGARQRSAQEFTKLL